MKQMNWFHHRCTPWPENGWRGTFLQRRQSCWKKATWTLAIFLMSCDNTGEQEWPQTSEPYDTVGKTKASNKRLIMGKDFSQTAQLSLTFPTCFGPSINTDQRSATTFSVSFPKLTQTGRAYWCTKQAAQHIAIMAKARQALHETETKKRGALEGPHMSLTKPANSQGNILACYKTSSRMLEKSLLALEIDAKFNCCCRKG